MAVNQLRNSRAAAEGRALIAVETPTALQTLRLREIMWQLRNDSRHGLPMGEAQAFVREHYTRYPTDHVYMARLAEGSGQPTDSQGNTAVVDTSVGAGTPQWSVPGPYGVAPRFNLAGDVGTWRFDLATPLSGLSAWTVSSWAIIDDVALSRWLHAFTNSADSSLRLIGHYPYDNNNGMWVGQFNGGWDSENYGSAGQAFRDGEWHHYVTSYSDAGQTFKTYYDGQLVESPSNVDRLSLSLDGEAFDRLFIPGNWVGADPVTGSVQDYRLYNRIITDNEAEALYAQGARLLG